MEQNWRVGRLQKSVYLVNAIGRGLTISDDCVAWELDAQQSGHRGGFLQSRGFSFLDTESMEMTEFLLICGRRIMEEILVHWDRTYEVRDPKNQWIVNVGNAEVNVHRHISFAGYLNTLVRTTGYEFEFGKWDTRQL